MAFLREANYLKLFDRLKTLSITSIILIGYFQISLLATLDYFTGYEYSFAFFYLIPVALIAWFATKRLAILTAFVTALTWQLVNLKAGEDFSHFSIPMWNTFTRLGFFLVVAILLIKLKNLIQIESELARTDYLTGAANIRLFYEIAEAEIERARRYEHVFSLCYFDIDNFKELNDTHGHQIGNKLLTKVVKSIKTNLRSSDVIARLGGDEFAILLPETNLEQANSVVDKIREKLKVEMDNNKWNVTFSMGVLTCEKIPNTFDEIIKIADALMYEVKTNGKDSVKFELLTEIPSDVEQQHSFGLT